MDGLHRLQVVNNTPQTYPESKFRVLRLYLMDRERKKDSFHVQIDSWLLNSDSKELIPEVLNVHASSSYGGPTIKWLIVLDPKN